MGSVVGIEDQLEVERAIARILGKGYGAHYTILSLQRVVFNGYFFKEMLKSRDGNVISERRFYYYFTTVVSKHGKSLFS